MKKAFNGTSDGWLFGNPAQFGIQAAAVAAAMIYSGIGTFVLLKIVGLVFPLRASRDDEAIGLDMSQHGEEAYTTGEGSILVMPDVAAADAPARALTPQPVAR